MVSKLLRTHDCGQLSVEDVGKDVILCGWINKIRNLGSLFFIDIRDKYGITQINLSEYSDKKLLEKCSLESVIKVCGVVNPRPDEAINKDMLTGYVEVCASNIEILSLCEDSIPLLPSSLIKSTQEHRMRYRYLDLRNNYLQNNLLLRSQIKNRVRSFLSESGFVEIETPILYKSTPEGARDFLVPSRLHPKAVYALPQSPQTLKQLLMIGGIDRYFQICRCFRDEDFRGDRQPEFTQIDVEISFATKDTIKYLTEQLLKDIFQLEDNFSIETISYKEAMDLYGTDKPDLRFGLNHMDTTFLWKNSSFSILSDPANKDGLVKAIFLPKSCGSLSRKSIDELSKIVRPFGIKGVGFYKTENGVISGGISKFITNDIQLNLEQLKSVDESDGIWFFIAGLNHKLVHGASDALRRHLAKNTNIINNEFKFVWVEQFPLFNWSEGDNRFFSTHHPFTMVDNSQVNRLLNAKNEDILKLYAQSYDVVCNGYEIGGGSIRIHDQDIQTKVFEILNMNKEQINKMFGFFIEALKYGVPPHGGIAFGLDRIMMLLCNTNYIGDVIAFPKTSSAIDLMSSAPTTPSKKQVKELHFKWD